MESLLGGGMSATQLSAYMLECRDRVLEEIQEIVPEAPGPGGLLYELMLDYPLRGGKALRPALCIATCRALGGHLEAVLPTAAVLELYHNAFLIHDDVEDGSEKRRNQETLHRLHGVPIAVNVGDGILALTMEPLLDNIKLLGLGRALRIMQVVSRMSRESAEGQMMELDWIRRADWTPSDRSYVRMVYKKTSWYTFITPVMVGAIAAGAGGDMLRRLVRFATPLGIAFQIQDDILNLVGEESHYGKEIGGDLWEGKHTLMLIHALRSGSLEERSEALRILVKKRPGSAATAGLDALIERLAKEQEISAAARICLQQALETNRDEELKTERDVRFLRDMIDRSGGVAHASGMARARARRAQRSFAPLGDSLPLSNHRKFLEGLVNFVVQRSY